MSQGLLVPKSFGQLVQKISVSRRAYIYSMLSAVVSSASLIVYGRTPELWGQMLDEMVTPILPAPRRPDPRSWPDKGLFATWLGHSTVLLKIDGFTILTDPVFGPKIGVALGPFTVGFKRLVEPAVSLRRLPHIDLILLSHAHMDHLDRPSLRKLENKGTVVVTARNTADLIRPERYGEVYELGWGEGLQIGPVQCRAFEVKHWGARIRHDHYRGYNGYLLETSHHRVVFAGDTAFSSGFGSLRSSRRMDLMIMPIGAYDPYIRNHCTPEQALHMADKAGADFLLPVHHRTFNLSREPAQEPLERLLFAARNDTARVAVREIGGEFRDS
jgi:L-ascorbate metabolism protein UlaG (beta-lactamase superfamily)